MSIQAKKMMVDRHTAAAIFLVVIGCLQLIGDLIGSTKLRGFGLAIVASPAPKVFTAQQGFETYANRFYIEYFDNSNEYVSIQITSKVYQGLNGPYNRRNMFGAVTSYGPVLIANPVTQPMFESVLNYAFCNGAPLLKEMAIDDYKLGSPIFIRIEPTGNNQELDKWTLKFQVSCNE